MTHRTLVLALGLLLVAACGDAPRDGATSVREPGVQGKPNPALGQIACAIVERPAPDRAVIEAEWSLGADVMGCEIVLELPEGAVLVDGERATAVQAGQTTGRTRWTVGFPTGRTLDAVVRLCGTTAGGFRITEAYARLGSER
ncbi:MAG: hypothetical protein QNJ98_01230 [Planctomycetota bacterium]|nr:hypothetical protein [Planctomycetota bacterium]